MPHLFSAQYGPRDPSQDAFSLLKYMPWKGSLCKSKVASAGDGGSKTLNNLLQKLARHVSLSPAPSK